MSSDDSREPQELSYSLADRIDLTCDQFEAAWNACEQPAIESSLAGWTGAERIALLRELIDLEIALRQARGEQPSRRDYAERFGAEGIAIDGNANGGRRSGPAARAKDDWPGAGQAAQAPGTRIGPYKLLQQIGEGGMGVVYMAEQEKPVRRRVALKIVKPGMDTGRIIARFEAERQALALMDHPNIARVLDAGTTGITDEGGTRKDEQELAIRSDSSSIPHPSFLPGLPYFVMDLVRGIPITDYCDNATLSASERLALFLPVCQAIQHAHQKGIIHRDIKPSNVMVTLIDGKPVPKIIDFGVAKATEQRLTERTMFTEYGAIIGTPEYMSPEQADLSGLDVDTRSDVYSLGVLLYELMTGSTPLERQSLRAAGYDEVLRRIKQEEPPRPSTRISHSGDRLASIAATRRVEPARLSKLLRGELDWIVMKALEKERSRRYETANGLARDIKRYLDGDPVEAGPPSAAYKLRKFARKHRAPLAAAGAFAALLVIGVVVSTVLAVRARHAEAGATKALIQVEAAQTKTLEALQQVKSEQARTEAALGEVKAEQAKTQAALARATEEEQKAKKSAAESLAVLEFFQDKVLAATRPEGQEGGLGKTATIRQAIDAAEPRIAESFRDQPAVEASIRSTLGTTYKYLGEPALAIAQHERSLQLRRDSLGPDHPDTLTSMNALAVAYEKAGKLNRAIALHEQALEAQRLKLGEDHPDTLISMNNLALDYAEAGNFDRATRLHEQALKATRAKFGEDHRDTLMSMNNLALAYWRASQVDRAIPLHEQTLKASRAKLGENHPDTLVSMNNLATAYQKAGKLDRAIPLLEQTLKAYRAKLGERHPDTLVVTSNLAATYRDAGQFDGAIPLLEQTLNAFRAKLGEGHPNTLTAMNNLAQAYAKAGELDRAIALHEQTLKACRAELGKGHPMTLLSMNNLAAAYRDRGQLDRAILLHEQTLKARRLKLGEGHPDTLNSMNNLAVSYRDAGQLDRAIPLLEQTLNAQRAKLGEDHPDTLATRKNLARAYEKAHRDQDAEALYRVVVDASGRSKPRNDRFYTDSLAALGGCLIRQQKFADAVPILRNCLDIKEKTQLDDWTTANARSLLGEAVAGQSAYPEAERLLLGGQKSLDEKRNKIRPIDRDSTLRQAIDRLIHLYEAWGKPAEAEKWRKRLPPPPPGPPAAAPKSSDAAPPDSHKKQSEKPQAQPTSTPTARQPDDAKRESSPRER